jgi:hypothetical protein
MAVYTPQIRAAVKSIPAPMDFALDIVEYDFVPPYIGLRFYESQWRHMSESERLKCTVYIQLIKKIIESHGIQTTIDPVYDLPGTQEIG